MLPSAIAGPVFEAAWVLLDDLVGVSLISIQPTRRPWQDLSCHAGVYIQATTGALEAPDDRLKSKICCYCLELALSNAGLILLMFLFDHLRE